MTITLRDYLELVKELMLAVEYTIKGFFGKGSCTWPNNEHNDYDPLQWWNPGYLQIIETAASCECGAESVYGSVTTHSYWCPKDDEFS